jgi:tRNA A-37 threonylcarbamoyl transferase component Bud32
VTELSVQMEYTDRLKKSLRELLQVTIPFWGFAPAILVIIGVFGLAVGYFGHDSFKMVRSAYFAVVGILVPLCTLLLLKYLSRSSLRIDRNGLDMPSDLIGFRLVPEHINWRNINNITVTPDDTALPPGQKKVHLLTDKGATLVHLDRLDGQDIEKLLVAIDLFYGGEKNIVALEGLAKELKIAQRNQAQSELNIEAKDLGLTYTELWEDELKRRFKAAAFMPLSPGLIMKGGSLTVVRQLALGGLSAVYLCQLDGKKLVVLKESVVPEDAKAELKDKAREMFAREAQLLMKINHPHIVHVLDYFVEGGRSYLMLDYVSGQDLRQYVKQNGRLREFQVIEWAQQIAAILAYLHNQEPPILHRDFTPDNLVVCADQSIVAIDFGAANEFIGNATGTFVGKQAFIAPEQFRGKASIQSDIYAFGGTIFYLLTGEDPEALSQSDPSAVLEVSAGLSMLVADCTALELDERIKSTDEVLERLQALKSG